MPFVELPDELKVSIFIALKCPRSIRSTAKVCKSWNELIMELFYNNETLSWNLFTCVIRTVQKLHSSNSVQSIFEEVKNCHRLRDRSSLVTFTKETFDIMDKDVVFPQGRKWFEILGEMNDDALDAFAHNVEIKVMRYLQVALSYKANDTMAQKKNQFQHTFVEEDESTFTTHDLVKSDVMKQCGDLIWNPWVIKDTSITIHRTPLATQLQIVRAMLHKAGIPKFTGEATRIVWSLIQDTAMRIMIKACLICANTLDGDRIDQVDNGEDESETECSSDEYGSGSDEESSDEDEDNRKARFLVGNPNSNYYVITPSTHCVLWAASLV